MQLLLEACPEDTCLVGPTAKGLLPGMYKLKDFKDIPGVGMAHKLEVGTKLCYLFDYKQFSSEGF